MRLGKILRQRFVNFKYLSVYTGFSIFGSILSSQFKQKIKCIHCFY